MFARIRNWFKTRFRFEIPDENGDPYLIRYRLISTTNGGLYLHHIVNNDAARDLHDHPWDFWTLILSGGYVEELPAESGVKKLIRRPGRLIAHRAEDLHRVLVRHETQYFPASSVGRKVVTFPAWTLVWVGPKRREWGFMTKGGWTHWTKYEELP